MKISAVFPAILVLVLVSVAHGGTLDEFYLQKYGLSDTNKAVAVGVAATDKHVPDRCRTWLHHDLQRDWDKLEPQTQKVLQKVLPARPALTNEGVVKSSGGHFQIHYAASGGDAPPLADANTNGIPDWVETTADVFEAVYNREVVEMGYQPPPTVNNQPYDVYLQNVGLQDEFGETASDVQASANSYTSYIILDNDFSSAEFGSQISNYTPLKALQITAAHEFHHAIQYGYNIFFESWFAEATSTWMEDEVYDSVNQLYSYVRQYLTNTTLSLDTSVSVTTGGGYGRWIFNRYLAELYTPVVVRNIWESLRSKPAPSGNQDIPVLPVIDEVLQARGSSLPSVFLGFNKRVLRRNWTSHQDEINLLHPVASQAVASVGNSFSIPLSTLPAYSFILYRLQGASAPLVVSFPNKPSSNVAVAFTNPDQGNAAEFATGMGGTITVSSLSPGTDVNLLVSNNGTGAATAPAEPTQAVSTPADATNPFPGAVTVVTSPSTTQTPVASEGGGGNGGCFIATAAFGSYLHPKVQILRDFRDNYLVTNPAGRAFVKLYYALSPPVAEVIGRHESLRAICRVLLAPVVAVAEHARVVVSVFFLLGIVGACVLFEGKGQAFSKRKG